MVLDTNSCHIRFTIHIQILVLDRPILIQDDLEGIGARGTAEGKRGDLIILNNEAIIGAIVVSINLPIITRVKIGPKRRNAWIAVARNFCIEEPRRISGESKRSIVANINLGEITSVEGKVER